MRKKLVSALTTIVILMSLFVPQGNVMADGIPEADLDLLSFGGATEIAAEEPVQVLPESNETGAWYMFVPEETADYAIYTYGSPSAGIRLFDRNMNEIGSDLDSMWGDPMWRGSGSGANGGSGLIRTLNSGKSYFIWAAGSGYRLIIDQVGVMNIGEPVDLPAANSNEDPARPVLRWVSVTLPFTATMTGYHIYMTPSDMQHYSFSNNQAMITVVDGNFNYVCCFTDLRPGTRTYCLEEGRTYYLGLYDMPDGYSLFVNEWIPDLSVSYSVPNDYDSTVTLSVDLPDNVNPDEVSYEWYHTYYTEGLAPASFGCQASSLVIPDDAGGWTGCLVRCGNNRFFVYDHVFRNYHGELSSETGVGLMTRGNNGHYSGYATAPVPSGIDPSLVYYQVYNSYPVTSASSHANESFPITEAVAGYDYDHCGAVNGYVSYEFNNMSSEMTMPATIYFRNGDHTAVLNVNQVRTDALDGMTGPGYMVYDFTPASTGDYKLTVETGGVDTPVYLFDASCRLLDRTAGNATITFTNNLEAGKRYSFVVDPGSAASVSVSISPLSSGTTDPGGSGTTPAPGSTGNPTPATTGNPTPASTGNPTPAPASTGNPTPAPASTGTPVVTPQPSGSGTVTPSGSGSTVPGTAETTTAPTSSVDPTSAPTSAPTNNPPPPDAPVVSSRGYNIADFVERLYTVALGRASDPAGKQDWIDAVTLRGQTGADLARGFLYSPEFFQKNVSNEEFVKVLYRTFFDREADADGLAGWVAVLDNGGSKEGVIEGFINSTEWANLCLFYGVLCGGTGTPSIQIEPNQQTIDFATRLYTTCLGRDTDPNGLMAWALQLANQRDSGTGAAHGFFFSSEFLNQNVSNEDYVNRLYRTFMGREADQAGFDAWVAALNSGASREEVFNGFAASQEFGVICSQYGILR